MLQTAPEAPWLPKFAEVAAHLSKVYISPYQEAELGAGEPLVISSSLEISDIKYKLL